jgi:hypothetical protein
MAGGGSIVAANYIYRIAKPDGLTLAMVSPGFICDKRMAMTRPLRILAYYKRLAVAITIDRRAILQDDGDRSVVLEKLLPVS